MVVIKQCIQRLKYLFTALVIIIGVTNNIHAFGLFRAAEDVVGGTTEAVLGPRYVAAPVVVERKYVEPEEEGEETTTTEETEEIEQDAG